MNTVESAINGVVYCLACGLAFNRCTCEPHYHNGEELRVTHSGVLEIAGHSLKCHVLNNGQRIFDADDLEVFLS